MTVQQPAAEYADDISASELTGPGAPHEPTSGMQARSNGCTETGLQVPEAAGADETETAEAAPAEDDAEAASPVTTPDSAASAVPVPYTPRWAHVYGSVLKDISLIVGSPFRAKLPPSTGELQRLAEDVRDAAQPLRPFLARQVGDRLELLHGHDLVAAGRLHLGWTEVALLAVKVDDNLEAAFMVIGDNRQSRREKPWEEMRAVKILFAAGAEPTGRAIAARLGWSQSKVSELKGFGLAITSDVLDRAGIDEFEHAAQLRALGRSDLRYIRGGTPAERRRGIYPLPEEVATRLRERVDHPGPRSARTAPDVSALLSVTIDGDSLTVGIPGLSSRTEAEIDALAQRASLEVISSWRKLR